MHLTHIVAALVLAASAIGQEKQGEAADGLCSNGISTVTETSTVSAISTVVITETVASVASVQPTSTQANVDVVSAQPIASSTTDIGAGITSINPAAAASSDTYYYVMDNGTTSWIGDVAPETTTSEIFFYSTLTLTVVPVPASTPTTNLIGTGVSGRTTHPAGSNPETFFSTTHSTVTVVSTVTETHTGSPVPVGAQSTPERNSTTHVTMTTTLQHTLFSTVYNWNKTINGNATYHVQGTGSPPATATAAVTSSVQAVPQFGYTSTTFVTTIHNGGVGVPGYSKGSTQESTAASTSSEPFSLTIPQFSLIPSSAQPTVTFTSTRLLTITLSSASPSGAVVSSTAVDAVFASRTMITSVPYSSLWSLYSSARSSAVAAGLVSTFTTLASSGLAVDDGTPNATVSDLGVVSSTAGTVSIFTSRMASPWSADNCTTNATTMSVMESTSGLAVMASYSSTPAAPNKTLIISNTTFASPRSVAAGNFTASAVPDDCTTSTAIHFIPSSGSPRFTNTSAVAFVTHAGSSGAFILGTHATAAPSAPTVYYMTAASSKSTAAPQPTSCGEVGNFTVNWDDEPLWVPSNGTNLTHFFPPVTEPYHHLFFSNGYGYVAPPNPNEPYAAYSSPNLCMFDPTLASSKFGTPDSNGVYPGEIGAGRRSSIDAYWFNATSAEMGCDGEPCTMMITGYKWDEIQQQEAIFAQQNATIPACNSKSNCTKAFIQFDSAFQGLTGVQFEAVVNETVRSIFVMDNLKLGWYNDTCAAGKLRFGGR